MNAETRTPPSSPHPPSPETPLQPGTLQWLDGLARVLRPVLTAQKHPHVVTRLHELSEDPRSLHEYFCHLVIDDRGERHGFSFEVFEELMVLLHHFKPLLDEPQRRFWDQYQGQMNCDLGD